VDQFGNWQNSEISNASPSNWAALSFVNNDGAILNLHPCLSAIGWCGGGVSAHTSLGGVQLTNSTYGTDVSAVPVPAAVWLFGSGLIGLVGLVKRKKT